MPPVVANGNRRERMQSTKGPRLEAKQRCLWLSRDKDFALLPEFRTRGGFAGRRVPSSRLVACFRASLIDQATTTWCYQPTERPAPGAGLSILDVTADRLRAVAGIDLNMARADHDRRLADRAQPRSGYWRGPSRRRHRHT